MARRVVPAVALLGAAGGLLVALDHPGSASLAGVDSVDTGSTATASGATAGSSSVDSAAGAGTSTTIVPSSGSSGSASASGSRSTTSTVPETPACTGTTVTGSSVRTKYGPVQVQAVVASDGSLCSVSALQTPSSDRKSQAINARAVPTLTQRALSADSADFSAVSGATITSNAYKQSLQSILDQS